MGSTISQLPYWTIQEGNAKNSSSVGGTGQLSYNTFIIISFLGGFIGLDHLYLRSPSTALAKMIINSMFFGVWWIYDISQAFFNKDIIKIFGLTIPGLGPAGIGAGCLGNDVPHNTHMNFFVYGLSVIFGGLFGLDSFILGENQMGIMRIICLVSFIGIPVAMAIWFYNMGMFVFKTKDITDKYHAFFGAPFKTFAERVEGHGLFQLFKTTFMMIVRPVELAIVGFTTVFGKFADAATSVSEALSLLTGVPGQVGEVSRTYTKQAADEVLKKRSGSKAGQDGGMMQTIQTGGMIESSILPCVLIGTLLFIAVSGIVLTYRRSKKNEPNDSPPEPGVPGEPDKKECAA